MTSGIRLRPANRQDSADILRWRNHPQARKISFHSQIIGRKHHQAWFERKLRDPLCRIYIIHDNDHRLGQVRLDGSPNGTATISIALDAQAQGKGVGQEVLRQISHKSRRDLHAKRLIANIKPANIGSLILFMRSGFVIRRLHAKNHAACCVLEKDLKSR